MSMRASFIQVTLVHQGAAESQCQLRKTLNKQNFFKILSTEQGVQVPL